MEAYLVFRDLAIIVIFAKVFGIVARKLKAPQVVGEIIAGLLIGPSILGLVEQTPFLTQMAEIGVVLLMFSAGLETNLKDLLKTGPIAFLIACSGVFVPLLGGTLLYMGLYGVAPWGSEDFYKAVFVGVIMTATSVSITVQALKELGKLKGKVGSDRNYCTDLRNRIQESGEQSHGCGDFYYSLLPCGHWRRFHPVLYIQKIG